MFCRVTAVGVSESAALLPDEGLLGGVLPLKNSMALIKALSPKRLTAGSNR